MQVWWFSFFVASTLLVSFAVAIPTTKSDTTDTEVPREFPKYSQNYTFVDNSSIRENLAKNSKVDTEVEDLLKDDEMQAKNKTIPEVPPEIQDEAGKKAVVEWIENGDDTEDGKFPTTTEASQTTTEKVTEVVTQSKEVTTEAATQPKQETKIETTKLETTTETTKVEAVTTEALKLEASESKTNGLYHGVGLIDGSVAAILVGFFLVFCILGYTALILWRRALEKKYGSREILVDEDIFDPDDMRHFSI